MAIIARAPGRFGEVTVLDQHGFRSLCCGQACMGSAWLEPTVELDGTTFVPGPIPEAHYLLGWLVVLAPHAQGHVLMAGLGSGAGPVALTWAFPEMVITVAEIDPVVIALAREHFPLLRHFEAQGRIVIRCQDIAETVWQAEGATWTAACLDAYDADEDLVCTGPLLNALHGRAGALWLNVLDQAGFADSGRRAQDLRDAGWTPRTTLPIQYSWSPDYQGNVLLGTESLEPNPGFRPFSGLFHPRSTDAHDFLEALIRRIRPWHQADQRGREDDEARA